MKKSRLLRVVLGRTGDEIIDPADVTWTPSVPYYPSSLAPAEQAEDYGTDDPPDHWLPLVSGEDDWLETKEKP